jgi:SAM-dependent methyltransferase
MDREGWNRKYLGAPLLWSEEPNRYLVEEVAELPPGRALDLGSGEGRNAIWLAEHGWQVTGVEFADVALERARRIAADRGVTINWIQANVLQWHAEPASFDLVLLIYLHFPGDEMNVLLRHAQDAAAPDGTLLLVGHDRTNIEHGHGGPQDPSLLYEPDEVAAMLTDVDVLKAEKRERPVKTDDGTKHAIDCLVRAHRASHETSAGQ